MSRPSRTTAVALLLLATGASLRGAENEPTPIALVKMPYRGERNLPDLSEVPDYLEQGGIADRLQKMSCRLKPLAEVRLLVDEQKQYGEWNRLFNTPETTLSGMLGGMPVATSAGLGLTRLRLKSGLDPALPTRYIVLAGVRDTDPLEQDLIDRSEVEQLSVADIRARSESLHRQMQRLSRLTDVIYVHVDMDVLDPREVPGHPLAVPDGPTSAELAAALEEMFRYPKAVAFGVASTPAGARDPEGVSRRAAYALIEGAVRGIQKRSAGVPRQE